MLLFARPREVVGKGKVELELAEGSTAADAFAALAAQAPGLDAMRAVIRPALDNEYATWASELTAGCELALIPPTAGG